MSVTLMTETNLYDDQAIKSVNDKIISQYGICQTSAGMSRKIVTVDGSFSLYKNVRISVFFTYANTTTAPTMNVNNTGAKEIWAYGAPLSVGGNSFNWVANSTIEFVYDGSHWLVADSSSAGLITKYDESLNQEVVFNKLTNNGEAQGIYLQNGKLYLNFDYARGQTLKLGGLNNANGLLEVYDASGNLVGKIDSSGTFSKSFTAQDYIYVNGGTNSYIKIPSSTYNANSYVELSANGFVSYLDNKELKACIGQFKNGNNTFPYHGFHVGKTSVPNTIGELASISFSNIGPEFHAQVDGYTYGYLSAYSVFVKDVFNVSSNTDAGHFYITDTTFHKNLRVNGTKSRVVETNDYGDRLLYCYETPSPMFGDVGDGIISDDGKCYVMIDSIFAKTVTLNQYQVFLQKYGNGDCWVSERNSIYFIVEGTPGLSFGWELKAKQSDFDQLRLEKSIPNITKIQYDRDNPEIDYAMELINHVNEIKQEREVS